MVAGLNLKAHYTYSALESAWNCLLVTVSGSNPESAATKTKQLKQTRVGLEALMLKEFDADWLCSARSPRLTCRTKICFRSSQTDSGLPMPRIYRGFPKFRRSHSDDRGLGFKEKPLRTLKKANSIAAEWPFAAQAKIKDVIVLVLPVPHSRMAFRRKLAGKMPCFDTP